MDTLARHWAAHRPTSLPAEEGWLLTPLLVLAILFAPLRVYGDELYDHVRPQELAADEFALTHGPRDYQISGDTRTFRAHWRPSSSTAPFVEMTGPLYQQVLGFLGKPAAPAPASGWQYDNGDVRISILGQP